MVESTVETSASKGRASPRSLPHDAKTRSVSPLKFASRLGAVHGKLEVEPVVDAANPFVSTSPAKEPRGRSPQRASSLSHQMTTRSRSRSLGTRLSWSKTPSRIVGNFLLAVAERSVAAVQGQPVLFLTAAVLLAVSITLVSLEGLNKWLATSLLQVSASGLAVALGFGSFSASLGRFVGHVSTTLSSCSSGNLVRVGAGQFQCLKTGVSMHPLARLFLLTGQETAAWAAGALCADGLLFAATRLARQSGQLAFTDKTARRLFALLSRGLFVVALIPVPLVPDLAGLIAGATGVSFARFLTVVLLARLLVRLPLQVASAMFVLDSRGVVAFLVRVSTAAPRIAPAVKKAILLWRVPLLADTPPMFLLVSRLIASLLLGWLAAAVVKSVASGRVARRSRN